MSNKKKRNCNGHCETNKTHLLPSIKGSGIKGKIEIKAFYCRFCNYKWNLEILKHRGVEIKLWRKVA